MLRLRTTDTPGLAYTGAKNGPGDPALKADAWSWHTLSVALGEVSSARVCAGLQTGAGAEALYLDNMRLTGGTAAAAASCAADMLAADFDFRCSETLDHAIYARGEVLTRLVWCAAASLAAVHPCPPRPQLRAAPRIWCRGAWSSRS